ncbi:MAG: alpha/beta fold hydrolase [Isosphaeraceae bacterium]|nr:alpha/beta fold hydrolase [Isosphaeraceae bacterium]
MSAETSGSDSGRPPRCLVLHGLGGGPYEVAPLIDGLAAEGAILRAPTLPGHDGLGPVMPASRWQDWFDASLAELAGLNPGGNEPVVVVGFSTGATLALRLAAERRIDRLILLAPFLAIRYSGLVPLRPTSYLRRLSRVVPNLPRRPPAVRDSAVRRSLAGCDRFTTFSLAAAASALELIEDVVPRVPSIRTPTLILQGTLDTVVEPSNAAWLLAKLGSSAKRLEWLSRSDHLLALDRDRDRVMQLVLDASMGRGEFAGTDWSGPGADVFPDSIR